MFKNTVKGEVQIGDRKYCLLCDADSPVGEIHDALMQMKGAVVDRMIAAHKEEQDMAEKQKQAEQEQV